MELHFLGFLILFMLFIGVYELYKLSDKKYNIQGRDTHLIMISKLQWTKDSLRIKVGDKVIFKNMDDVRLQIVNNDAFIPNSQIMGSYDEYSHIFLRKGKYTFKSNLYRKLGSIVITVD